MVEVFFRLPTVDRETVEIDISHPQTVFAPVHVDGEYDPDFYAGVQEMVDDFLGHEATLNLFPDIVVHNRFATLDDSDAETEQIAEPELELATPEGKRSRKKKPLCNLGYLDKTKKKQQLAKKRLMQKVTEKSRRTLDPTGGYGSLDEHSSDDEEEEIIQSRRVKRKGKIGKKAPKPLSIDNLLNSRKAFYHEDFPHLNKDTKISTSQLKRWVSWWVCGKHQRNTPSHMCP